MPGHGGDVVAQRASHLALGRVSADSLAAYPPGTQRPARGAHHPQTLDFLRRTANSPFGHVRGAVDPKLTHLRVLATTG